jgi:16S rRNA processing protein RimM
MEDSALPFPEDAIEVGRIVGAFGIKGELKIKAFAADPQALFSSKRWFLRRSASVPSPLVKQAPPPSPLRVKSAREHGEAVVASAHDITDRNAAEALVGCSIWISRASFPTPAVDEFYWVDLIGLAVANREGVTLGHVADLIETGPSCVLRVVAGPVAAAGGAASGAAGPKAGTLPVSAAPDSADTDILIPFVAAYVDTVDLPGRLITVDWQADY